MARKTSTPVSKTVHIRAVVSFMDIREGDESVCPLDDTVQGWLNAGYIRLLEVINGGEDPAGPSGTESDDAGGVPDGGGGGSPAGSEQGEGSGAG